jgi:hypothetical protein
VLRSQYWSRRAASSLVVVRGNEMEGREGGRSAVTQGVRSQFPMPAALLDLYSCSPLCPHAPLVGVVTRCNGVDQCTVTR